MGHRMGLKKWSLPAGGREMKNQRDFARIAVRLSKNLTSSARLVGQK